MNLSPVNSSRFQYPLPTCTPPMYNSPLTPSGTTSCFSSSTYICTFAIARPIGTTPPPTPGSHSQHVTSIAASVGPYRLYNFTPPSPAPATPTPALPRCSSPASHSCTSPPTPLPAETPAASTAQNATSSLSPARSTPPDISPPDALPAAPSPAALPPSPPTTTPIPTHRN